MLREATIVAILALAALALVPAAPALPLGGCETIAFAEESLQNDAGGGADAPDTPEAPLRIAHDGYYSGYLSTVGHANADRADWYVYSVPEGILQMDANITWEFPVLPTYTVALPTYAQAFTMTVFPPDGSAPMSVTPYDPTLTIPSPEPGDYVVRVTATTLHEFEGCEAGAPPPPAPAATTQARNHGMYLGCNPVCAGGGANLEG